MEKKRWSLIFIGLCLALAFSVSSVEAQDEVEPICEIFAFCDRDTDRFFRDHKRCAVCYGDPVIVDCDDSAFSTKNDCGGGDDGDTNTSKQSIPLIMTFDDREADNIQSDGRIFGDSLSSYIDNEGVGVSAGERSQPNPAAGIHMGLRAKPRVIRQLDLNIICEPIPPFPPYPGIDKCNELPVVLGGGVVGFFPRCVGNQFCDLGTMVRPYKVNCPKKLLNGKCPDVFTMAPTTTELMSFRVGFGLSPTVELASAIGADGSQDPGRCLSLHSNPAALAEAVCTTEKGTHDGDDGDDLLVDSTKNFAAPDLNITVGADIVKNVDDGSQGVITGITGANGNTITVTLAGGTENDWDIGEAYTIVRTSKCNVSVTAFDNDAWEVVADGVTALICNSSTSTVIGKATLTFGFKAIKKEGAIAPF